MRNGPFHSCRARRVRRLMRAQALPRRRCHEQRQLTRAGGERLVRERRVVGGQVRFGDVGVCGALDEEAWLQRLELLGQALVVEQHLVDRDAAVPVVVDGPRQAAGQRGFRRMEHSVRGHDAPGQRRTSRQRPEADGSTPILHEQSGVAQSDGVDELGHPLDVGGNRVGRPSSRLVRATETDEVGRHRPQAEIHQVRDHLPVEVGPGRLSVQHKHGVARRAFVDIVHAQSVRQGHETALEGVPGQVGEPSVRRAHDVHVPQCVPTWRDRRRGCWTRGR